MSLWRRIAIEQFPELQSKIAEADNAYDMWLELNYALSRVYKEQPENEALISRIYGYAAWCVQQPRNDDLRTAVMVCFYEHLPLNVLIWKDVARWLSEDEFIALRPAFGYHLTDKEVDAFADEFFERKGRLAALRASGSI